MNIVLVNALKCISDHVLIIFNVTIFSRMKLKIVPYQKVAGSMTTQSYVILLNTIPGVSKELIFIYEK